MFIKFCFPDDMNKGVYVCQELLKLYNRLPNSLDDIDLNKTYNLTENDYPNWLSKNGAEKLMLDFLYSCEIIEKHELIIKTFREEIVPNSYNIFNGTSSYIDKKELIEVTAYIKF